MALRAANQRTIAVGLEAQGAERHPLIHLHVVADVAGFADHHAGAVVDEKAVTNGRARMDVDAGLRVGGLGHHPRNVRHAELQQHIGEAIDRDRLEAGVAKNNLMVTAGRRVAAKSGGHIQVERLADGGQSLEELDRLDLGERLVIDVRGLLAHVVPQGPGDLRRQLVVQGIDQAADVVLDIADMEILPATETGVDDLIKIADDVHDAFAAGQRLMPEMIDPTALGVAGHQGFGDLGESFLDTQIGSHDRL